MSPGMYSAARDLPASCRRRRHAQVRFLGHLPDITLLCNWLRFSPIPLIFFVYDTFFTILEGEQNELPTIPAIDFTPCFVYHVDM